MLDAARRRRARPGVPGFRDHFRTLR